MHIRHKFLSLIAASLVATISFTSCSKADVDETTLESEISASEEVLISDSSDASSDISEETTAVETELVEETDIVQTEEDTTAPFILSITNDVVIHPGDDFDVNRYISYIDDQDTNPTLTVEGEVNINRYDTYPLSLTIEDASGNVATASMNVTLEPTPTSSGDTDPDVTYEPYNIAFEDFREQYRDEANGALVGIDVSKWQGQIDFNQVAAAGCDFVMMRVAIFTDEFTEDPYFRQNIQAAKDAGLMVGVYYYSADNDPEVLREHIAQIMEILDGVELDFPIAFDWESWSNCQRYNVSISSLRNLLDVFCDEVETYGYEGMLYGSKYYLESIWNSGNGHTTWVAHYNSYTDYQGDYIMWQVNCIGSIPGINGDVDIDVYYEN